MNISPIGQALDNLFFITSDERLEMFVSLNYAFDTGGWISEERPELYSDLVSEKFYDQFIKDFKGIQIKTFEIYYKLESSKKIVSDSFTKKHLDYIKELSLNKAKNKISFSEKYINSIQEFLESLSVRIEGSGVSSSGYTKDYFSLCDGVSFNAKDLRNSLILYKLIDSKSKEASFSNLFKGGFTGNKINWLVNKKGRLQCFLFLLKEKKIVTDEFVYRIAKNVFTINNEDIIKLDTPKAKDYKNYIDTISSIIDNSFTL